MNKKLFAVLVLALAVSACASVSAPVAKPLGVVTSGPDSGGQPVVSGPDSGGQKVTYGEDVGG